MCGAKSKTSGADHYIHYRGEKLCKYDECRSKLIMAIAKLEHSEAQAQVSVAEDGDEAVSRVEAVVRPKAVAELKPSKLAKNIQPVQFESWKKSLESYWLASRFHTISPKEQIAHLRSLVNEGLLSNIE